jgi:peptidoglycan/xylan/chitin deacetylase (PgdA/CDA1 family)|tara:strand:+ start:5948 stop:6556 length:609 start_codon:yes stop_codon:yes gene_type:complete
LFVKTPKILSKLFPSLIWKIQTKKKEVWLTFDDGPDEKTTPLILSILEKLNIKATFFLIGREIEKHPSLTKSIIEKGHIIGNHSYSHLDGYMTSNKIYYNDIFKNEIKINNLNLYRPPFGRMSLPQIWFLRKKFKIIMWDIFSWDFIKNNSLNMKNNVINNIEKGSIIVFHNNAKSFSNLSKKLEEILIEIQNKGYNFSSTW